MRNTDFISLPNVLNNIKPYLPQYSKCLVISDDVVSKLYLDTLVKTLNCSFYIFNHGEDFKTLDTVNCIYQYLMDNEFDKKSLIITLGGGIVGDLGGFIAGTYLRGVSWVNIPTTTLSMVDSSIGGKVGVNFNGIKNQIGMFYYPETVFIDVSLLETLDETNFNSGLVEALKLGLVGDEVLYEHFKKDKLHLEDIIERSIKIKSKICMNDEFDQYNRHILNFGHTFGHAIESIFHNELTHGECVGFGMIPFINDENLKKSVIEILMKLGIDYNRDYKKYLNDKIIEKIVFDKKRAFEYINIVELNFIKDCVIKKVKIEDLKELL